ncbi:DUF2388 domain-containing protein [Azomonas macrocytogenes]|uniref:Uncharacterized protein (TIGR02448 family) n=1 Tax=Azomonas macrocytogenes TaxID=69962 RepID=A0A839T2M9_AZOMA|nr:DUF2388 domain-containing protein [Azomonas macrocytogenes]MBB3103249.1 uncharacterized protein (TIGR02448 family) [Azomonas macrocytogenes]
MRKLVISTATLLTVLAGTVEAHSLERLFNISTRSTDRTLDFTSDTTTSVRDMKVVVQARAEAASFVATNGDIRGAQLEAALKALRERFPQAREASDLTLAETILAL